MSGFRARPDAKAIAAKLPMPEEARVQDILAAAGATPQGALANLAGALARLVVERSPEVLHERVLGAVCYVLVQQVLLRRQRPGRAG